MQRSVASVLAVVRRTSLEHGMVERGDRVLVAVSGGPDSAGLLAALSRLREKLGIELVAAHVNHRLRGPDADADEACARVLAERCGAEFLRGDLNLGSAANLEERARQARYAELHRMAVVAGCRRIATGHTRDDQAETVLLRLMRGSGPAGLAGIEPCRADGVIRPLIDCTRSQVLGFVGALELPFRYDRSNEDPRFQRVRVRSQVLPLMREINPAVSAVLARTADLLRAERGVVEAWTEDQLLRLGAGAELDLEAFRDLPPALRGHVLRAWLVRRGVAHRRLSARHVASILGLVAGPRASGSVVLPGGVLASRSYARLRLCAETPRRLPQAQELLPGSEVHWGDEWWVSAAAIQAGAGCRTLPTDLWAAVCDADRLPLPLTLRRTRAGDRVRPLGLGGSRKLSDVFVDRKVPAATRPWLPVVEGSGVVIWVPGVVRSEAFAVRDDTRSTILLRARREPVAD